MYVPYGKTTRESNVSILNRLYLSDISCGTWEAVQKCDKLDNGLDTRWYLVEVILTQMKKYLLKVENVLKIPKTYILKWFDTISR
jgi:hypothetical protein